MQKQIDMSEEDNEFSGGKILRECPHCGQYCKAPEYYYPVYGDIIDHVFAGCFAESYCKRCKKKVKLGVIFI